MRCSLSVSGRGYSLAAFWKCEPRKFSPGCSAMHMSKKARMRSSGFGRSSHIFSQRSRQSLSSSSM